MKKRVRNKNHKLLIKRKNSKWIILNSEKFLLGIFLLGIIAFGLYATSNNAASQSFSGKGELAASSFPTGQQALDKLSNADKNKNGLFTRVFVQEMQKPSQSIDRVVKNVRNQVAELAKSVGHEQVPAIYDQVLGDFYFKK